VIATPIEPRGGIARYHASTGTTALALTAQRVPGSRRQTAASLFKLPLDRAPVHAPAAGGSFGMKTVIYAARVLLPVAARPPGRDPAELRLQDLIASFPRRTAVGMALDSGDFVANLDAAVARADTKGFAARRAAVKARGRLLGIGVACFLETSRGAPNEG